MKAIKTVSLFLLAGFLAGTSLGFLGFVIEAKADESPQPPIVPTQFEEEIPKQPKLGRYDSFKIDWDTAKRGRVVINFGDDLYIIPIECPK